MTAGDAWMPGDLVAPRADLTDYRGGVLKAGVPVPILSMEGGYVRITDPMRGHSVSAFTFVSRPAEGVGEVGAPTLAAWEETAEGVCAEVIKRAEATCRKATDELYEGLLYSVQDYLRENVMLNLGGELDRAHDYERDARAALVEIAEAAGVDFVDSRDGVERQKERILAALTLSPPVQLSERERAAVERMNTLSSVLRAEAAEKDGQSRQDDLDDAEAIRTILAALTRTTEEG